MIQVYIYIHIFWKTYTEKYIYVCRQYTELANIQTLQWIIGVVLISHILLSGWMGVTAARWDAGAKTCLLYIVEAAVAL